MKWNKISKSISSEGTTITYKCDALPGITIESRKRHIPHANRAGTWDHTSYFVIKDGKETEKWSLKDAQEFAERMADNEQAASEEKTEEGNGKA